MDSDGDGYISAKNINIDQIPKPVLEKFAPLLCDMENRNETYNLEGFLEEASKLLKVPLIYFAKISITFFKLVRKVLLPKCENIQN